MTTREQLTFERFEALCDLLSEQGTIPTDWREALAAVEQPEQGHELRRHAREGRGPPDWASGSSDPSGSGKGNE